MSSIGLSAVLAFAESYAMAGKYTEGIISGIVTKCLTSPKVRTRELSHEIVLMFVEIEKQDLVVEELIKGLDNKTPKIVAASASLIKLCLNNYGVKIINVKPIVKVCHKLIINSMNCFSKKNIIFADNSPTFRG